MRLVCSVASSMLANVRPDECSGELSGDGSMLSRVKTLHSSILTVLLAFSGSFFLALFFAGVTKLSFFRFKGEMFLGSTDGDFRSGESRFLNLEMERGVLFDTNGRIWTSGVIDWLREESSEASRVLLRNEYDSRVLDTGTSSIDTSGTDSSSSCSFRVQPFSQFSSHVLQRHSQLSSPK